jgi:hypothetical protein
LTGPGDILRDAPRKCRSPDERSDIREQTQDQPRISLRSSGLPIERLSTRGRCCRSSDRVRYRRDDATPKRWAHCRAWADGVPAAARLRSGAHLTSKTAGRMDWPVASRRAAYDRAPHVRGHDIRDYGHPGRKHRYSLPMSELSPPGSGYVFAFQLPPKPSIGQPKRNFTIQSTPPTETALILPPRGTTRGSAASFVGSAFGTIFGKNFGTICCNRSSAGRARSHGAAGRSARRSRIWRARRAWVRVCRRAPARQRQLRQGCVTRARKAPQHQAEGYLPRLLKSHGNVSAPCPAREPPTRSYSGTIQSAVVAPPE